MPIAGHQLVQEKLVWMISEITKAQLLALQVGKLEDAGGGPGNPSTPTK
jgi:glutaryl-CoA dehydrogenase